MTYVTHHEDINPSSIRKYSLVIAQAVALVLRNHQRRLPICETYKFDPPEEIAAAAEQLIEAFSLAKPIPQSEEVGDDDASDATLCEVTDDVFHDDEFYVPDDDRENTQAKAPSVPLPPTCSIIQPKLRKLIRALYCQLPAPGTIAEAFDSVLVKFLVMASRLVDGNWRTSSGITQLIAALTFGGRLAMYDKMVLGLGDASSLKE